MSNTLSKCLAAALLIFMLLVAVFSMRGGSAIMDEASHLPAGYSYVTQGDMRINPEHPPLVKDLAGLAVVLMSKVTGEKINFPYQLPAWQAETKNTLNAQWDFGFDFLYHEGNPAGHMIFAGRLPMLLILLLLGMYIFIWTKELWGKAAALLALFFFSFSPTFIAHGRLVTTDVAAATGIFIATYYFIRWLKNPKSSTLILAGLVFGLSQLTKFSTFLLVPFFGFLVVAWIIIKIINRRAKPKLFADSIAIPKKPDLYGIPIAKVSSLPKTETKNETVPRIIFRYLAGLIVIFIIGYVFIVTPFYYLHIRNYPPEKQLQNAQCILASYANGPLNVKILEKESPNWCMEGLKEPLAACKGISRISRCPADLAVWMADKSSPIRAFGYYLLGLVMVVQRATGGNTTYFLGQISNAGWTSYFPIVYLLKEPLALHIFTLIAIASALYYFFRKKLVKPKRAWNGLITRISLWLSENFVAFAMLVFIALYWITSVRSPLNIGVRHVLPTFPLIYGLVAWQIIIWARKESSKTWMYCKYGLIGILVAWQAISVIAVYPSFLAYFNEIVGGSKNGYQYVVDSNLDWGQDLKRLKEWTDQNHIQKIYVDYFGGGDAQYYLGDKFQPWWGDRNPSDLRSGDWLAVSATFLQGGRGQLAPGYVDKAGYFDWLNAYEPKAVIGYSIFVYQIP